MVNENLVDNIVSEPYKYGFVTEIESEKISKGINEDIVRLISSKKNEPEYLLNFRLDAFKKWKELQEPDWADLGYEKIIIIIDPEMTGLSKYSIETPPIITIMGLPPAGG